MKNLIGRTCVFNGSTWKIVSLTNNMLGVYFGLIKNGKRAVAHESAVYIEEAQGV